MPKLLEVIFSMAEQEVIWLTPPMPGGVRVRHIGLLHLDELYRWLQRWFEFEGYYKKGRDFEEFYQEKINPNGSKKIEIRWKGKKDGADKKEHKDYFSYHIEISFLLINVQDVTVEKEGQQIKMQKGDYEFRMGAYLKKGMKGDSGFFKKIYEKLIIDQRIEEHRLNVYDDVYKLHEQLSEYLNQPL